MIKRVEGVFKSEKKRWPDALGPSKNVTMQDDGFYIWNPKVQSKAFTNTLSAMLVIGVILACCFPIWPVQMKLGVWYLSVILLVILLGLSAIRLVAFVVLFIFGHDFWIFPNMYDDSAGIFGGFSPLYYYQRRNDGWTWLVIRLLVGFSVTYFPYLFYTQPTLIDDIQEVSFTALFDFVAWGEDKILSVRPRQNSTAISIPRYESLLEDEDLIIDRS
jgi:translocation protein SEC62